MDGNSLQIWGMFFGFLTLLIGQIFNYLNGRRAIEHAKAAAVQGKENAEAIGIVDHKQNEQSKKMNGKLEELVKTVGDADYRKGQDDAKAGDTRMQGDIKRESEVTRPKGSF